MECGHSAIREFTKLRGKGHIPHLAEVSAKSICRFVAKHHDHRGCATEGDQQSGQPTKGEPTSKKGGGGPWRAFVSERSSKTKLTRQGIRNMKEEYRNLSAEEFAHYKRLGHAMTIQHRLKKSQYLNQRTSQVPDTIPGHELVPANDSNLILADPQSSLVVDGDDFGERFNSFKQILRREQKSKKQSDTLARQPEDPTDDGSHDMSMSQFVRAGGPGLVDGLRRHPTGAGAASLVVDRFHWKLPIVPFVQAVLDEGARAEDELKVIELEDAWTRLHELVQHSDQKELDFRNGGGKPFPITACSKLGTCVCSSEGKAAALMIYKLKAHMKACHPGTHKEPSQERMRFYAKLCVLELCSEDLGTSEPPMWEQTDGSESKLLYLHCGYTNFSTWETTCTRLHECFYNPINGA